jgi:hypothetical protein
MMRRTRSRKNWKRGSGLDEERGRSKVIHAYNVQRTMSAIQFSFPHMFIEQLRG